VRCGAAGRWRPRLERRRWARRWWSPRPSRAGGCDRARAKVRSTTRRRGCTGRPIRPACGRTIWTGTGAPSRSLCPWWPRSAQTHRTNGIRRREAGTGGPAPSRSRGLAALIPRAGRRPSVSTDACRLRPTIRLAPPWPAGPPLSHVSAAWPSMIAGLGEASRPHRSRPVGVSRWPGRAGTPVSRSRPNRRRTVPTGGKPSGRSRHGHPERDACSIASVTSRMGRSRCRPRPEGRGRPSSGSLHPASVRSLA
jgi:hypothetical protein